jgi:adenylate cyclase
VTGGRLGRLLRVGVPDGAAPLAVKHVTFLNGLCLLAIAAAVGTTAARLAAGGVGLAETATFTVVSGCVPPLVLLWLSARGHNAAAVVGFACYVLLSTAGAVLLFGPATGIHYYFLVMCTLASMLFPVERRRTALWIAAVFAAVFVATCLSSAVLPLPWWPAAQVRRDFQLNLSLVATAAALAAFYAHRVTVTTRAALAAVRQRTDALLGEVLPAEFVERLRDGAEVVGRRYARVSIVVCDIAGFTHLAEEEPAEEIVRVLNTTFGTFDRICRAHGADKIKTVGDAYVAGVGMSQTSELPARAAVDLALRMQAAVEQAELTRARGIRVRIGIGTGPAIAGVVGTSKLAYDVWGAAIDSAAAMEMRAEPGQIVVDAATWEAVGAGEALVIRG